MLSSEERFGRNGRLASRYPAPMPPAWLALYESADLFRTLTPWRWIHDYEVFGVRDPATGQIGWCSVMGNAGEFFGLGIYRGDRGYDQFKRIQTGDPTQFDDVRYGQDAIIVAFLPRKDIGGEALQRIRDLGLRPRGKDAWIAFEDHRPGRTPIPLTDDEVSFCKAVIDQAFEVGKLVLMRRDLLGSGPEGKVLVRERRKSGKTWASNWIDLPKPPEPAPERGHVDQVALHRARAGLARLDATWEVDVFPMGPPVEDEAEAYIPAVVMIADSVSGFVVHVELGHPGRRDELVRGALMHAFEQSGAIPARVAVTRDEVQTALAQVAQAVGFELVRVEALPMVQEARESFEAHIGTVMGSGRKPKRT